MARYLKSLWICFSLILSIWVVQSSQSFEVQEEEVDDQTKIGICGRSSCIGKRLTKPGRQLQETILNTAVLRPDESSTKAIRRPCFRFACKRQGIDKQTTKEDEAEFQEKHHSSEAMIRSLLNDDEERRCSNRFGCNMVRELLAKNEKKTYDSSKPIQKCHRFACKRKQELIRKLFRGVSSGNKSSQEKKGLK